MSFYQQVGSCTVGHLHGAGVDTGDFGSCCRDNFEEMNNRHFFINCFGQPR